MGVGTGNDKIFRRLLLRNIFLLIFKKRGNVTEVVVSVSFNFSIYQGQYQRPNHHCHSHHPKLTLFAIGRREKNSFILFIS